MLSVSGAHASTDQDHLHLLNFVNLSGVSEAETVSLFIQSNL